MRYKPERALTPCHSMIYATNAFHVAMRYKPERALYCVGDY